MRVLLVTAHPVETSYNAALRDRIRLRVHPTYGRAEAKLIVLTTDGRRLTHHVRAAMGSRGRPMSDENLETKVRTLTVPVLGTEGARRLMALCRGVENLVHTCEITEAACALEADKL